MKRKRVESWEIAVAKSQVRRCRNEWSVLERERFEDLVQDGLVAWLEQKSKYDPGRGASQKTFMAWVVRGKLSHIKDRLLAQKRKAFFEAVSLDELFDESGDTSSENRKHEPSIFSDPSIGVDLSLAIQKLSPHQKMICRLVRDKGFSFHEISRRLKRHPSWVYREAVRIRRLFEREGLGAYLGKF